MTPEEYKEKYKHIRVIYVSDDGFWIDGEEVCRRLGTKYYPEFYFLAVLKPSATFYELTENPETVRFKTRKYKRYRFRNDAPIPDEMIEWVVRQGKHKDKTS